MKVTERYKLKQIIRAQKRILGHKLDYATEKLFELEPRYLARWIRIGRI